jgi:glycosyltransferase involved in cell wall biosynthesis
MAWGTGAGGWLTSTRFPYGQRKQATAGLSLAAGAPEPRRPAQRGRIRVITGSSQNSSSQNSSSHNSLRTVVGTSALGASTLADRGLGLDDALSIHESTSSVVIISAVSPIPVDNGKRAVLSGLLEYFLDRLGPDHVHYALVCDPEMQLPNLDCHVHRLDRPTSREQMLHGGRKLMTSRQGTLQEALLGSDRLRDQISALLNRLQCDLEVYDTLRLGQHRPESTRRSVIYMDDLFSVRYERILAMPAGEDEIDPLGEFVVNVPPALRSLARKRAVYRALLGFEARRIAAREIQVAHEFDTALLVSRAEVSVLRHRSGSKSVRELRPMLPDVSSQPRRPADPPQLVFLGRLNIPHNDDGIRAFIREAAPEIRNRWPESVVRVVGSAPTPALSELAAEHDGFVVLEGFVEDLDAVFAEATVLLAPLRFGSGIKIKIIDALARGVPVIGTSTALEGIPVRSMGLDGCIIEDDLSRWPDAVNRLIRRQDNMAASAAALEFHRSTHSREAILNQYDDLFGVRKKLAVPSS